MCDSESIRQKVRQIMVLLYSCSPDDQNFVNLIMPNIHWCSRNLFVPCTLWEFESWPMIRWGSISFVFSLSFSSYFSMSLISHSHHSAFSGWPYYYATFKFCDIAGSYLTATKCRYCIEMVKSMDVWCMYEKCVNCLYDMKSSDMTQTAMKCLCSIWRVGVKVNHDCKRI